MTEAEANRQAREINEDVQRDNGMLPPVRSEPLLEARKAFVALILDENFYTRASAKFRLRAHWRGRSAGFADQNTQRRWEDFWAGWKSCSSNTKAEG